MPAFFYPLFGLIPPPIKGRMCFTFSSAGKTDDEVPLRGGVPRHF